MDQETGITGWILAGIGTIVATLSGIIARFYQQQVKTFTDEKIELKSEIMNLRVRADKCDEDRQELRVKHAVLENNHAVLARRVSELEVNKKNRDSIG